MAAAKHTPAHTSRYPIPPYSFDTNEELAVRLERDEGDVDEICREIDFRRRLGGWMTPEQQAAAIDKATGSTS
jgi:hypothetical protein